MKKLLVLLSVLAVPAAGQAADDSRYQLEKVDGAIVRLDRQTGMIATCAMESGQVVCRNTPDEIAAYDASVTELEARVARLEKEVAELKGGAAAKPSEGLPTDEEFERTLGFMEKFFRRFKGIIEDLDAGGATGKVPDKT